VIFVTSKEQIVIEDGVAMATGIGFIITVALAVTCEHPAAAAIV
jgi:hypothetical protein